MAGSQGTRHKEKKRITSPDFYSDYTEEGGPPMWLPDELIRNKKTGDPLLVLRVYRTSTVVTDQCQNGNQPGLCTGYYLLRKDYHYYARDTDMKNKDPLDYEEDWYYKRTRI